MKKHYYHDDLRVDRAIRTIITRISQGAAAMRRHPGAAGVVSAAYWLLVLVLFMGHNPDNWADKIMWSMLCVVALSVCVGVYLGGIYLWWAVPATPDRFHAPCSELESPTPPESHPSLWLRAMTYYSRFGWR